MRIEYDENDPYFRLSDSLPDVGTIIGDIYIYPQTDIYVRIGDLVIFQSKKDELLTITGAVIGAGYDGWEPIDHSDPPNITVTVKLLDGIVTSIPIEKVRMIYSTAKRRATVMPYTYGTTTIPGHDGYLATIPNYASWIDMALDESYTLEEKCEMLTAMAEYAKSLPEDWPKWQDGSPVMVGQIAMSWHGPMVIGKIEKKGNGYDLLTATGYTIDAGNEPYRIGEYQDFWPGNDDRFAEHVLYHEATGSIGPQCWGGTYTWEMGIYGSPESDNDPHLPLHGINYLVPKRE